MSLMVCDPSGYRRVLTGRDFRTQQWRFGFRLRRGCNGGRRCCPKRRESADWHFLCARTNVFLDAKYVISVAPTHPGCTRGQPIKNEPAHLFLAKQPINVST